MKSRISKYCLAIVMLALLAGAGCTTTSKVSDPRVEITYPLGNAVNLMSIETFGGMGEGMTVQLTLRNHSNSLVKMLYKIDWYTADGKLYDTVLSKWKKRQAYDRETFTIKEVAPSDEAVDFRVQLRKE